MNILFVCTGNTCRSPMAEVLGRAAFAKINCAENMVIHSAGTAAFDGFGASEHAVAVMTEKGLDLSAHVSRRVTLEMVKQATIILTMTEGHKRRLLALYPGYADKVSTLHAYAKTGQGDVADPYGQDIQVYAQCAAEIDEAVRRIAEGLS